LLKHHLGAAAICAALATAVAAPAAQAAGPLVTPSPYAKNLTCEDVGYTTITKFDPPNSGIRSGITLTRVDGSHIDWSSTVPVDAVMVKGGDGGNLYEYPSATFADDNLVTPNNASGGPAGLSHVNFCAGAPRPGIDLEKTVDKAVAYAGETLNYTLTVTNTGNTTLDGVDLGDELCDSDPARSGANAADTSFDAGDVWTYTCSHVVPTGVDEVVNTAKVCYESSNPEVEVPADEKCDEDSVTTPVERIGITVDKTAVEQTAVAGTTVHFTIAVTNTGTTSFVSYTFTDVNCDAVRTGANAGDATFDPGDVWTYSCAMATSVGDTSADNRADAEGTDENGKQAEGTDSASVPLTQPGGSTPDDGSNPGGGVLPGEIVSGRARLRGPSGCVRKAFRASVRGRAIATVRFYVDGRLVKKFTGTRSRYSIKVRPRGLGLGRHRIVARVTFAASSKTSPRTLRLTFRRCAKQAVSPRFTG
jgi:uncharacterized repeat protein (TIGR01451 family)